MSDSEETSGAASSDSERERVDAAGEAVKVPRIDKLADKFVTDCIWSGDVTLEGLQEMAAGIPGDILRHNILEHSVLHHVVNRGEVTLEVVQFLLKIAPDAAKQIDEGESVFGAAHPYGEGSYPLHLACFNANCPTSVVRLLLEAHPSATKHAWRKTGLPLHCYLERAKVHESWGYYDDEAQTFIEECPSFPTGELDSETVKLLVDAYPEALTVTSSSGTPMHVMCEGSNASLELARLLNDKKRECLGMNPEQSSSPFDTEESKIIPILNLLDNHHVTPFPHDLFRYLLECNPSSMKIGEANAEDDEESWDRWASAEDTDTLLHKACSNPNIAVETVQLILDTCPEMAKEESGHDGFFPIHKLCKNGDLNDEASIAILQLLLEANAMSAKQKVGRGRMPEFMTQGEYLPIHLAVKHKSFEFCKFLVDTYPNSATKKTWYASDEYGIRGRVVLPFHLACMYGSLNLVKYLLEKQREAICKRTHDDNFCYDEEVDFRKRMQGMESLKKGNMPLHLAASRKKGSEKMEIIDFLLRKTPGAVSAKGKYSNLPLHKACRRPTGPVLDIISKLFYLHPEAIHAKNVFGQLPIHLAMRFFGKDDLEALAFLAKQLPYSLGVLDKRGLSCAHHACASDAALEKLKLIVDIYPKAIQSKSDTRGLPLHHACKQKKVQLDVVKFLVGQYPEALEEHAEPIGLPLHCCSAAKANDFHENRGVFEFLLTERYKAALGRGVPLFHAFLQDKQISGKDEILLPLTSCMTKEDKTTEDEFGRWPVHLVFGATMQADILRRLLMPCGAISKQDNNGWLPLHYAMHYNSPVEVTEYILMKHPEHPGVPDKQGATPLHIACRSGQCSLRTVELLVGEDWDLIRRRDSLGRNALHSACEGGASLGTVKLLVGEDRDLIQRTDNLGRNAMHAACDGGASLEVISFLAGEDQEIVHSRDGSGRLPLHAACDGNASLGVIRYLLYANDEGIEDRAQLVQADEKGEIPLHKACGVGNASVIKYIMAKDIESARVRNNSNELPLHLLCDGSGKSNDVLESTEYVDALFQLLLAQPETLKLERAL